VGRITPCPLWRGTRRDSIYLNLSIAYGEENQRGQFERRKHGR